MELNYRLNEEIKKASFIKGELLNSVQTLQFPYEQLSPKARELWAELFGPQTSATLKNFTISGGEIWEDGSVSRFPPQIVGDTFYQSAKILTVADLEGVLTEILAQKKALEAELPQHVEKWNKARSVWEQTQAEEQARAEEKAKRLANLPWVKQIVKRLSVVGEVEKEIQRFTEKFGFVREDISVQNISYRPYVYISASVPVNIAGMERQLRISNKTYDDVGGVVEPPEFSDYSDLSQAIALSLAEIFKGEVKEICNFDRREAFLNVQTGPDTICVDRVDLESDDC